MASLDNIFGDQQAATAPSTSLDKIFDTPLKVAPHTPSFDDIFAQDAPKTPSLLPKPNMKSTSIAAPKPADTSSLFSKFLNFASNKIEKAITPPDLTKTPTPSAFAYLPSELARQIPGVAELQDNPGISDYITAKDTLKEVPGAAVDVAKGFAAAPVEFGASMFDAARVFVGKDPRVKFTLPVLGEISSVQYQVVDAMQRGEDPVSAAIGAGSKAIFDTLFFADIVARTALPRATKVAERTGDINEVGNFTGEGPRPEINSQPKSGRLYEQPTAYNKGGAHIIPPEVLSKIQSQGIKLGSSFKPEQPVFFKTTLKGKTFTSEMFQVKPSLLEEAYNKIFGPKTGPTSVPALLGEVSPTGPKGLSPADLGPIAANAAPKDTIVLHSKSVGQQEILSSVKDAIKKQSNPSSTSHQTPTPPTVAHTVAHNVLRLGEGDTSKAKEGEQHLIDDIKQSLNDHGPEVTSLQLQEKIGVSPETAQRLLREAKAPRTPAEIQEAHQRALDGVVTPEGSHLPGINPEQSTRLSNEEAVPLATRAAGDYYISKIAPAIKEGRMVTINADELKKHFGEDYNDHNHPVYSRAAGMLFERALTETKSNSVIFLGGGPGSGKSEILVKHLEEHGFRGIVYDTNLSNKEGAKKFIQMARDAGKDVGILGILPNLENARGFTIQREEETGRGITDKTFANGHHGFPDVARQLLEEGHIPEDRVKILDTRELKGIPAAKSAAAAGKFVKNTLASLQNLGYTKEDIEKTYAKENYTRQENGTFARRTIQENAGTEAGEKSDLALAKDRANEAGFIAPGQVAEDVVAGAKKVKETMDQIENARQLTGDVRSGIYQHEGARKANRIRLAQMIEQVGKILDAEGWEQLYHYDENKDEHLSPSEKEVYDQFVAPLKRTLTDVISQYRELGGSITPELFFMNEGEYTPRFAKDKQSALDKLIDAGKEKLKTIKNGGSFSKSLGTVGKSRRFFAATDEAGKRHVIYIEDGKQGKVLGFDKGQVSELGQINRQSRESLLREEVAPLQKKIRRTQNLIDVLEGIKTRDPISRQKLDNMQIQIEALKRYAKEREEKNTALSGVEHTMTKEIEKTSDKIDTLETRLGTLKKFGDVPKVAKELTKLSADIDAAYEHETNLSLSDVYEKLSEFSERQNELDTKTGSLLRATAAKFKILSKVPKGKDLVLTKNRIENARDRMLDLVNQLADIESRYDPSKLSERVFVGKNKEPYVIGQATTKEIEGNTKTEYHKNVIANYVVALDRAMNALSAMRLLERIKNTGEFGTIIRKDSPDEAPPEGWKTVGDDLPQFRGYHMEPRTAEALADLAGRQRGQFYVPVFDEINNLLITAIVINPIMHVPNVISGRALAAAAGDVSENSLTNFGKAWKEVVNKGPLYIKYLEHGAPFMNIKDTAKSFSDAILTQYTDAIEKDPTQWDEMAKALGYIDPRALGAGFMHINETITWGSNDIFFMHALMDYTDATGGSMEDAIKEVSKRMADYRIPERILLPGSAGRALSLAMQSRAMMFGRFHYTGVIKPWIESAREGMSGNVKDTITGLRGIAYMLVMGLIIWPYINKMWQGITGSPTSYESMPGPLKPIEIANRLHEKGISGVPQALQSVFTPSPALRSAIELGFNVDLFNHNPIYGPLPAEGFTTYGTAIVSPLAAASRMTPADFALSLFGVWTPKNVPAKNDLQRMKYDELPALQTQVKKDILTGNVDKANEEMREFNNRVIAKWNTYQLETDGKMLLTTEAEKQDFLKVWGIKAPGDKALGNAATFFGDGSLTDKSSLISTVATYAKAIGTNPAEAFHLMFSGQKIVRVSNYGLFNPDSTIIVQRADLSVTQGIKAARGSTPGDGLVLDHVIPLTGGGTNDESNLNLIPASQNAGEQHSFELLMGEAVKEGKVTPAKVREFSIRYKVGRGQTLPPEYMTDFTEKYGGKTITIAEVAREIKSGSVR